MAQLTTPDGRYKTSFLEALDEYKKEFKETGNKRLEHYKKLDEQELRTDFATFVQNLKDKASGKNLPDGYVPCSVFWLVQENRFLGWVDIRHQLTPHLLEFGGHIGYDIRPSERGKGYGTSMLKLALEKTKELGIKDVLITCNAHNIGSKKIIETNGGVLENIREKNSEKTMRYRISV